MFDFETNLNDFLESKIAVHFKTKEDAIYFFNKIYIINITRQKGIHIPKHFSDIFEREYVFENSDCCFYITPKYGLKYADIDFYLQQGISVIEFKTILR